MSVEMVVVYLILAIGAVTVTRRLGLLPMSLAFWVVFASGLAVLGLSGHCISARWSVTPVCGSDFWWIVATSPEVVIFMLFMITDPMTSPTERRPRVVFGAAVGLTSALLLAPMQTEYGAKVAVLGGLVAVCALRPVLTVLTERLDGPGMLVTPMRVAAVVPLALAALVLAGMPARTAGSAGPTVASDALIGRPDVQVPQGAVPEVTVSSDVTTVVGDAATSQADEMAHDLVAALMIEAHARAAGDSEMAATAIAGQRLEDFPSTSADEQVEFASMEVVLVRDPDDPQAVPRFGIHATGVRGSTPLDTVYVLEDAGGTWLLTGEQEGGEA
jgi:hypothetical protein